MFMLFLLDRLLLGLRGNFFRSFLLLHLLRPVVLAVRRHGVADFPLVLIVLDMLAAF